MASPRHLMRHPLTWITIAWTGMLLVFMLVVPIYQAPDEPAHVDRVRDTATAGFSEWDQNYIAPDILASTTPMRFAAYPSPFSVDNAPVRPQPNFVDLGDNGASGVINQLAGHPPAYYAVVGGVRTAVSQMLPQSFWQFDAEVLLMRLINVLLLVPLPALIWVSATNLGMSKGAATSGAIFPLCIPQLAHIGSVVNNDNLLILSSAMTIMFATGILSRGLTLRLAVAAGLSAALAVQTKLLGLFVLPFLLVVCVVAVRRRPQTWGHAGLLMGILALSAWLYVRNLVLYSQIYPTRPPGGHQDPVPGFEPDVWAFVSKLVENTGKSFWGSFGWLYLRLPVWWVWVLSLLLLAVLIGALARPATKNLRLVLLPIALVVPAYVLGAWIGHTGPGYFPAQQGRYLFPLLVPFALAVASAASRLRPVVAAVAVAATATVGLGLSLEVLFSGFWAGDRREKLSALAAWSPFGWASPVAIAVGCTCFAGGLIAACWLTRTRASRGSHAVPESPPEHHPLFASAQASQ